MSGLSVTSFLQPLNNFGSSSKSADKQEKDSAIPPTSDAFVLDLSEQAKALMAAETGASETGKLDSLSDINRKVDATEVSEALNRLLVSRNINVSGKIDFSFDDNGKIIVTSDHPQKDLIEQAVNENNSLSNDVKKLLKQSYEEALDKVQKEYQIALEDDENKDDEEKKLELHNRVVSFTKQLDSVAGDFSLEGGNISAAVTAMATGFSF